MELSVITVTRNRPQLLAQKLASLAAQTLPPDRFELVICVNGCEQGSLELLNGVDTPFSMKVLSFATNEGAAKARNACAKQAQGEAIYLSDDDCLLFPDTLAQHLAAQRLAPVVAVGAIYFEHDGASRVWRPGRVGYWNVNGANTSLPRVSFEAVGGFDESLSGYGGEDILLGYRLKQAGLGFMALPEARVRHLGPDPQRSGDRDKARMAGKNAVKIVARHPNLAFRLGVHPLSLWAKRVLLAPPLGLVWQRLDSVSYTYERAYLAGALEEKRRGREANRT
ncbi:MAG: glycosyltransferase [Truepera sp.]|nr:glycosyltransferase [Truepera sp.]